MAVDECKKTSFSVKESLMKEIESIERKTDKILEEIEKQKERNAEDLGENMRGSDALR